MLDSVLSVRSDPILRTDPPLSARLIRFESADRLVSRLLFLMDVGPCLGDGRSHESEASGSWAGNGLLNWALRESDIRTWATGERVPCVEGWPVRDRLSTNVQVAAISDI